MPPPSSTPASPAPRLGLVGHLLAEHGRVTTTTEVMAELLRADGVDVRTTSSRPQAAGRLVDTVQSLLRWKGRVDLLLVSTYSGRSFVLADATTAVARARGLPFVLVLHGGALPDQFRRHPRWARRVLSSARAVVAPSEYLAQAARALGLDAEVIPNPLVIDDYPFRHRTALAPRLLWMRTFHPYYEPELAVRTLALVRRRFAGATLTMAGADDGRLGSTRALARELGVAEAVTFAGFLDPAGKAREFAAHDVFLNTNQVDNTPVSVLEAGAYGLPVVATAVGGIPHLLRDRESGLLVPRSDAQAMAAAVVELLDDRVLASTLSTSGRRLAERSAWPVVREQWFELIDRVLAPDQP
ncbi:MAG: glycosyltransferase family 4 protein [Acidimicrobiales bacterium]